MSADIGHFHTGRNCIVHTVVRAACYPKNKIINYPLIQKICCAKSLERHLAFSNSQSCPGLKLRD